MKRVLSCCFLLLYSFHVVSEDIELYIGEVSQRTGSRPQVLIIFDNSGSMSTKVDIKQSYVPSTDYPAYSGSGFSTDYVYYKVGSAGEIPKPDLSSEERRFEEVLNSCETAREKLNEQGFYTGYVRRYTYSGSTGSWTPLPETDNINNSGRSRSVVVDCWDDINLENNKNSKVRRGSNFNTLPTGYPIDGQGDKSNRIYYTDDVTKSNTQIHTGEVVTLYSQNYLRWYHGAATIKKARLDIAKETIVSLVNSAPGVDFGLEIFNINAYSEGDRDGGRIVSAIQEMTPTAKSNLINTVNGLYANTNTPLCESLYEAYRYFGGHSVWFGDDDSNVGGYSANNPPRDLNAEAGGVYKSPYANCSNQVYVIMITDGVPTLDGNANNLISNLPNVTGKYSNSYLPALAGWMKNNDINPNLDDKQTSVLYTVGFGETAVDNAGQLLNEAAVRGGGQYYPAKEANELLTSLQAAIVEILRVNSSFTSPSVASDNFDRTRTLDSVYYTMFLPDNGPRWKGNLKKLKLKDDVQVDKNNKPAIDSSGSIAKDALTYWAKSSKADGNEVGAGGVVDMMVGLSTRKVLSDTAGKGYLETFSVSNASSVAGSDADLAAYMNIQESELNDHFEWAKGKDIDDENEDLSTSDMRLDVFADPLHSKPLVINYGGSKENQDVRIIVGTNAGMLHMFKDDSVNDTVSETWAFMPYEFLPIIKGLRINEPNAAKIYGIDGTATAYLKDNAGDGTIGAGDTAWVFFGLRRGGSSYYALDVSDPDRPALKWHIDADSTGFSKLGQTWSKPTVTHIKDPNSGSVIPVLVIGGGYSLNKDSDGPGSDDTLGNAIFIINADTGALVWSASTAANSSTNLNVNFTDSIPSSVAVMDSNFDGLADRLYTGDTGGNIWRVDMPGQNPSDGNNPWTVIKLAALGGTTNATDLRFFNEPSIARSFTTVTSKSTVTDGAGQSTTTFSRAEKPFEAILIGSGDRTSPANNETNNKLFMIRDEIIITQSRTQPTVLNLNDLYNYTNNPYGQTLTERQRDELDTEVSSKDGWYINLTGKGEKSLSSPTVIAGVAYFNSFTPNDDSASTPGSNSCQLKSGGGLLYAVDLHYGTNVYNWRTLDLGDKVPDTPTVIISPSDPDKLLFVGVGEGDGGGTVKLCPAGEVCDSDPPPPCPDGEVCENPPNPIVSLKTMRTNVYVTEKNN